MSNKHRSGGPRSDEGKARSRLNSLKHGLSIKVGGLLPCRQESCYYRSLCPLIDIVNIQDLPNICAVEVARFTQLSKYMNEHHQGADPQLVQEFIFNAIAVERCNQAISLNPEIIGDNRVQNPYEFHQRYQKKMLYALKTMIAQQVKEE